MQNYWCENCDKRWTDRNEERGFCPFCSSNEIRKTMSKEEAEQLGLIEK